MEEDLRFTDERQRELFQWHAPHFFVTGGRGGLSTSNLAGVRTLPPLVGAQIQTNILPKVSLRSQEVKLLRRCYIPEGTPPHPCNYHVVVFEQC